MLFSRPLKKRRILTYCCNRKQFLASPSWYNVLNADKQTMSFLNIFWSSWHATRDHTSGEFTVHTAQSISISNIMIRVQISYDIILILPLLYFNFKFKFEFKFEIEESHNENDAIAYLQLVSLKRIYESTCMFCLNKAYYLLVFKRKSLAYGKWGSGTKHLCTQWVRNCLTFKYYPKKLIDSFKSQHVFKTIFISKVYFVNISLS